MTNSTAARSITQYGIQTPNSSTLLVVTTDRADAERALEWITDGHLVHRTVTYGEWQRGIGDERLAEAG